MKTRSAYTKQAPDNSKVPNLYWIEQLARIMDSKFRIPGTRFRFGLDPILGLIPIFGDVTAAAISGGLIISMIKYGVSRKVVYKMLVNVALDATIGSIPVLGWVFDFYYKANNRNIRLLKEHYEEGKHTGSGTGVIITVVVVILALIVLLIWGLVALFQWLAALI
ncbi:hypothetical protein D770_03185 [Flammeovirgaceae bacterium 311]|nr:hypothetical protein D770_03185 [Flammeovirgaceae bacterium 311]